MTTPQITINDQINIDLSPNNCQIPHTAKCCPSKPFKSCILRMIIKKFRFEKWKLHITLTNK